MNLDDAQKKTVAAWIAEGLQLPEIQKRLNSEFGITLTYMELRLLVDDLNLLPKDPPPRAPKRLVAANTPQPSRGGSPAAGDASEEAPAADNPPAGAGKVAVSVDLVAQPGSMVSGSVAFSDGQTAAWYLDQLGRLGIAPKQQGYKPTPADLQAFQQALERELSKLGF